MNSASSSLVAVCVSEFDPLLSDSGVQILQTIASAQDKKIKGSPWDLGDRSQP